MDTLLQDLKYAARQLASRPGFTAVAVLTLALGIGATTAIFSVADAVLLRPLPYPDAARLTVLWGARGTQRPLLFPIPDFVDWRARNHSFVDMGIVRSQSVNLTGTDKPDRLIGSFISASTLRLLGARTVLGRLFTEQETAIGAGQQVAVISYGAWQGRFGGAPDIVGRSVSLNGRPHVVIGVTAQQFQDAFGPIEVWLPITSAPNPAWFQRGQPNVWAVALLKPDVTLADAQRDLSSIAAQLAAEYPTTNGGSDAFVLPLRGFLVGGTRATLMIVLAFVGVVLLIACANVANLQLARATSRVREISVRAALGASRLRLVRQLLTESLALSILGGALGVGLAYWTVGAIVAAAPGGLPTFGSVGINVRVLTFSTAVIVLSGLLFGIAPALHGTRVDLGAALTQRSGDGGRGGRFDLRQTFVAIQMALCIVLLVGAGLLARTLAALRQVDPGFDTDRLLTAEFRLPAIKYNTPEKMNQFMTSALAAIRAVPGVRRAALVNAMPLSGNWGGIQYASLDHPELNTATAPMAQLNGMSDGAFAAMGIRLEGRDFDTRDRAGAPLVVIVNEELARRTWPGQRALGQRLRLVLAPDTTAEVIGVAANVKQVTLSEPATPQIYQPMLQAPGIFNTVAARTTGDPDALNAAVRAAIWSVDPDQPVWKMRSMEFLVRRDFAAPRFTMALTLAFALIALLLAAVGVYGTMSYAVVQRTREVGIRMALGARRVEVVRLVLRRGLAVIAIALAVGLTAALGLAPLLRRQLFGVVPLDPVTFMAVPLVLTAVALVACYLPARRAAAVDPMVALRTE
ncbi:MAG TPA: ABC transporter permease [Gemmatimonadales bacterium]|nr:ABC transporter permease [Gemmatimonadales bacterium]